MPDSTRVVTRCRACNAPIPPQLTPGRKRVYCSTRCHDLAIGCRARPPTPIDCPVCSRPFTPKSILNTYCSRECRWSAQHPEHEHTCEECGTTYRNRHRNHRFCTYKCNKKYQSRKHYGAGYRQPPRSHTCPGCNQSFTGHKDRIYCSDPCSDLDRFRKKVARQLVVRMSRIEKARIRSYEVAQRREARRRCACGNSRHNGKRLCDECRQRNLDARMVKVKIEVKEWRRRQRRAGRGEAKNHRQRAHRFGVDYDPKITRIKVLDRDEWVCGICHKPIANVLYAVDRDGYGTIDHIIPMSRGGGHVWSNVRAAHNRCNWTEYDRGQGVA